MSAHGVPFDSRKNLRNQDSLAWPNAAMSSQLSASAIVAQRAMVNTSGDACKRVRATRGSGRSAKRCSKSVMRPERRARSARDKTEHLSRAITRTPVHVFDALALLPVPVGRGEPTSQARTRNPVVEEN